VHGTSGQDTERELVGETELAARLRLVIGRLHRRIRIDGRESVPPLQLSAMVTVEEHGPLRLSELARREAVSVPTMSRVLTALDEQGLVVRTPDPQDARGVLVTLSGEGKPQARLPLSIANGIVTLPSCTIRSSRASIASTTAISKLSGIDRINVVCACDRYHRARRPRGT